MSDNAPRRGRPRDATRDRALLDATLEMLAEGGYARLTTAAVAARAGVSTATLYRRWPSKEALVVAAASAYTQELQARPDTGSLEGDLRALLRDKAAALTGRSGQLLRTLFGDGVHNTALNEALTAAFLEPVRRRVAEIAQRAVERGEIPPVEDADLFGDLVIGSMVSRFFLTVAAPEEVEGVAAEATADRLLPFLLRALGSTGSRDAGLA